jgi:hypothetical protein
VVVKLRDRIKLIAAAFLLGIGVWGAVYLVGKADSAIVETETKHYVRIAAVYEGDIDMRFYITPKMLESMAPQMVGKPMLLGHDWANPNVCVGRIVESAVKQDKFGHYLEVIVLLNNNESADMIRRQAYGAVSIGFMRKKSTCIIDGKDECEHEPGHKYKVGETYMHARFVLKEVEMYEVSFINVPASEHARVLEFANHRLSCTDSK